MACIIEILEVIVLASDGENVTRARVSGTATECGIVVVKLKCPRSESQESTDVQADGSWFIEFASDSNHTSCQCGDLYVATAHCEANEVCSAEPFHGRLGCPNLCPNITLNEPDIGECKEDGTRTVTFTARVDNRAGAGEVFLQWRFNDNIFGEAHTVDQGDDAEWAYSHDLPPGNYTALIHISAPDNCDDIVLPDEIIVEECPLDCPQIRGDIIFDISETCHADGSRGVTFDAEIEGNDIEAYHWEFGDGEEINSRPPVTHRYVVPDEEGIFLVSLTIVGVRRDCIDTQTREIRVPGCAGFPDIGGGSGYSGDDSNGGGGAWEGCLSVNCSTLLYIAIFLMVLATILAIVSCFAPPVLIAALIVGGTSLILFGLWAWLCSATTPCWVMQRVQCFLWWIVAVIIPGAMIIEGILWLFFGIGLCNLIAMAIAWAGWGALYAWLNRVMRWVGCDRRC